MGTAVSNLSLRFQNFRTVMKTRKPINLTALTVVWLMGFTLGRAAAQPLQFTRLQRWTNGEIVLTLSAPTGRSHRVEASTDLITWHRLVTFPTNLTATLQHTDSAGPLLAARFYRALPVLGTNIVSGDHLPTAEGDVVILPRNHATLVMQWNGKMIYCDPVSTATYGGLPKADLILVTHTHSDHFSTSTIDAVRGPGCIIVGPAAVYTSLTAAQKLRAIVLTNNTSTNVLGMTVQAVPAYNSNHPLGTGNGYVLHIGGKRLYISGDTGNQPEVRALTNIDVAFLCMNQPWTMSVSAATNCVRAMQPRVVYPYHYRDQSGATTNAATFKQWLGSESGIEVRLRPWY